MNLIWTLLASACAAGLAVQALDAGAKLRVAAIIAQWGALFWIGLRLTSFALGAVMV